MGIVLDNLTTRRLVRTPDVKPVSGKHEETGREYTLEVNRECGRSAESRGFVVEEVGKYPLTRLYELWFYAFRMHHKSVSRQKTDALLDSLGGVMDAPDGLFARLGELYSEGFNTLTDKSENPTVTVTF